MAAHIILPSWPWKLFIILAFSRCLPTSLPTLSTTSKYCCNHSSSPSPYYPSFAPMLCLGLSLFTFSNHLSRPLYHAPLCSAPLLSQPPLSNHTVCCNWFTSNDYLCLTSHVSSFYWPNPPSVQWKLYRQLSLSLSVAFFISILPMHFSLH